MTMPMPQQPMQPPQPPTPPWTPFAPRPNDSEPPIAMKWMKRLSKIISTTKFDAMPPEWQQVLVQKYQAATQVIQAVQQAQQPPAPLPKGVSVIAKPTSAAEMQAEITGAQGAKASGQTSHQPTQPTQATQPSATSGVAK